VKLLLYSHAFPPSVGGVETIVASLARGLSQLARRDEPSKLQVTVVTQTGAGRFDDASFPCRIVRQPSLLGLSQLVRAADIVHIAGPALAPMFLAWLLRKPYVIEHHGYQAICPNGILLQQPESAVCPGHFQAGQYRKCIRCESQTCSTLRAAAKVMLNIPRHAFAERSATNIAVSHHVANRIALLRTRVIYHGLEIDYRQPSAPNAIPSSANAKFRFGYLGRFVPEKGIPILLEAAKILRQDRNDFEVVLVGDGPLRPQIEDSIRRNRAEEFTRITGFLTGEKLAAALNALEVVVMPSIWEETAGLAAIEQMLRGRLVIVSDIGGLGEIVGDAGLKFPPGDALRLADQMKKVLDESKNKTLPILADAARNRAQSLFLEDRMVSEHAAAYLKLI
jgi:glycosyltransferase involved in cell wall biosynthesis